MISIYKTKLLRKQQKRRQITCRTKIVRKGNGRRPQTLEMKPIAKVSTLTIFLIVLSHLNVKEYERMFLPSLYSPFFR